MKKNFYLNTSIWRDYFEDRNDGLKPIGEFAFQFLMKCVSRKNKIIVSNEVKNELMNYFSNEKVQEVFSSFKEIIVEVNYSEDQVKKAHSS